MSDNPEFRQPLEALQAQPLGRSVAAVLTEEALDGVRPPVPTTVEVWCEDGSREGGHWELVDG